MNLSVLDWFIVVLLFLALNFVGYFCKRYSKNVSDFLVAGRNVGRYLGVGSDAMSGLAAVTILALWQMCYQAGFAGNWWYLMKFPIAIIVAMTGWGVYRFRQTRAMTIPQFLEMRYSRQFRIFAGVLTYIAGILNMGIFPIIGANFFVYFCGLPDSILLFGLDVPTVLLAMLILQSAAVAICFMGGQVTLIITDFIQSVFVNIMFIVIAILIYFQFSWDQFAWAYKNSENALGLIHPFKGSNTTNFNAYFFLIDAFWIVYNVISWSPGTMQVSSAKDAHEAKMMKIISIIRQIGLLGLGLFILPYAAFVLMHHPDFSQPALQVRETLSMITNEQVRSQMIVPLAVAKILPFGVIGAFTAVVMFAFIACHDTYLLAWGGIFIQDIVMPLRKKPLSPKAHIQLLRLSVLGSALFTIIWSMKFDQVDDIFMYFDVTASIYLSGAGIVILGGLYWKKGTTTAAWVSMIAGAVLSLAGFVTKSIYPEFIHGRYIAFFAILICCTLYIVVSLLSKNVEIDFKTLFGSDENRTSVPKKWWMLGNEFSTADKRFFYFILGAIVAYFIFFGTITIYNIVFEVDLESWLDGWHFYFYFMFLLGTFILLWITIGGIRDMIVMFKKLQNQSFDSQDDGRVDTQHYRST